MAGLPNKPPYWIELVDLDDIHEVPLQITGELYFPEGFPIAPDDLS